MLDCTRVKSIHRDFFLAGLWIIQNPGRVMFLKWTGCFSSVNTNKGDLAVNDGVV